MRTDIASDAIADKSATPLKMLDMNATKNVVV